MIADYGLIIEMFGFVSIAMFGLPGGALMEFGGLFNSYSGKYRQKMKFITKFRKKIKLSDIWVNRLKKIIVDINIPIVILGLILQHSWFANNYPQL